MIIIADQVTDGNGKVHNVTAVGSDLTNREALVSVTIGKNVTSVGNWAFYVGRCHLAFNSLPTCRCFIVAVMKAMS